MYEAPQHPYTFGLLNSFPSLRGARKVAEGIPGSPPDLKNMPTGCRFHPRCPFAMEVCVTTAPELEVGALPDGGTEHAVACHLHTTRAEDRAWLVPPGPAGVSNGTER